MTSAGHIVVVCTAGADTAAAGADTAAAMAPADGNFYRHSVED